MNREHLIKFAVTVFGAVAFYFVALPPVVIVFISLLGRVPVQKGLGDIDAPIIWLGENVPGFVTIYEPYIRFWEKIIGVS